MKMISIIVPTYNASMNIVPLLEKIREQTIKDYELLIIDSSSTDDTVQIARSFGAKILTIQKKQFDHGGTRSRAGKDSCGDILVFLTQDALPVDESSIEKLIRPIIEDNKIGATYGRQLPYPGASLFSSHLRVFNYPENSSIRTLSDKNKYGVRTAFLSNSFAAYRRSVLEKIGWFEESLIMGEDTCAGAKILLAGYKIAYVADARVFHSHSYTILQEFKRYFDIGVFHEMEDWMIKEFGTAEGEGGKYLRSEVAYLIGHRRYPLIPEFILRNGLKFIGYKLGHNYRKLPGNLVRKLSMHRGWWDKTG